MSSLEKLSIKGASYEIENNGDGVLHVTNPHALIQAAGYLKHIAQPFERVFFRGQSALYGSLRPSLYRDLKDNRNLSKRHARLNSLVDKLRNNADIFGKIPDYAHEPLLQHYGICTSWLDLVDNIWVALWFSVNRAYSFGKSKEFLHFDKRKADDDNKYGYIIFVGINENRKLSPKKGMMRGNTTELIDLRIAAPSIFLRPHAQHGLLFRELAVGGSRAIDYSSYIKGIARFNIDDAMLWLGDGYMHGVRSLFPPPFYDNGYSILLSCKLDDYSLGCIQHVGA